MKYIEETEILVNDAYWKFIYWFFSYPDKEFGMNDLVRKLRVSKTTASKVVSRLAKDGFLIKNIHGNVWGLKLNSEHYYNKSRRLSYNLSLILESGIVELINREFSNKAIILFGSYRKCDDNENSDIDLAVEVLGEQKHQIIDFGIIKKFGNRKNVRVQLNLFSRKNVNDNLFKNIANGIVLDGFLEA